MYLIFWKIIVSPSPKSLKWNYYITSFELSSIASSAAKPGWQNVTFNMCACLSDDIISLNTVKQWYQNFKKRNFDIKDEPYADWPNVIDVTEVQKFIDEDKKVISWGLASHFNVYQTRIIWTIKGIGFTNKFNWWVPQGLIQNYKDKQKWTNVNLLEYHQKRDFLNQVVTCDEKMGLLW